MGESLCIDKSGPIPFEFAGLKSLPAFRALGVDVLQTLSSVTTAPIRVLR